MMHMVSISSEQQNSLGDKKLLYTKGNYEMNDAYSDIGLFVLACGKEKCCLDSYM